MNYLSEFLMATSLIPVQEDFKISAHYSILSEDIVSKDISISISEYYKTKKDVLMDQLAELVGKEISLTVFNAAISIIENLPYSILSQLDNDNIYITESSTLVLDWEKRNSQFSLEIGSSSFEYFIDNNSTYSLNENLLFEENTINKLRQDLDSFLG